MLDERPEQTGWPANFLFMLERIFICRVNITKYVFDAQDKWIRFSKTGKINILRFC